jgi:hypothetical protein
MKTRNSIYALISVWLWILMPATSFAAAPAFSSLNQSDVDKLENELLENTSLHSVLPPSALGSVWGFEIGVAGGVTKTPELNNQVKRVNSSTDVPILPHAGIVGAVSAPFGITGEAVYLPKETFSETSYQQYALALKWTLTDSLLSFLPMNIAVRGFTSRSEFSFTQTVTDPVFGSMNINVANIGRVSGVQLFASPKLIPILEPYIGLGYLSANGTLSQTGDTTVSIFANGAKSMDSSPTSTQLLVGLDIRLLFVLGLGVEYSRAFGTESYTGKLSLKF